MIFGLLQRYLATRIIFSTLMLLCIVAALAWVMGFLGELREIGVGDYGFWAAVLHALLELPYNVNQFFPMLVLLGGLVGLGGLAVHQELIVMRVSGLSLRGIFGGVLLAVIVLTSVGMLIGEGVAPRLHYLADKKKSMEESGGQAVVTSGGLWIHQPHLFLHIENVVSHRHLEGITRYQFDQNHRLLVAARAEDMNYVDKHWVLHNLQTTTFSDSSDEIHAKSESIKEAIWDIQLSPAILNSGLVTPGEMPLDRLFTYSKHLVGNGLQATAFQFSFWSRVLRPLAILVMLLLSVPFVLSGARSVALGKRLLLGVVIGFVFYILNALIGQLCIIFQFTPWLAALFPILLFACFGCFLLRLVRV